MLIENAPLPKYRFEAFSRLRDLERWLEDLLYIERATGLSLGKRLHLQSAIVLFTRVTFPLSVATLIAFAYFYFVSWGALLGVIAYLLGIAFIAVPILLLRALVNLRQQRRRFWASFFYANLVMCVMVSPLALYLYAYLGEFKTSTANLLLMRAPCLTVALVPFGTLWMHIQSKYCKPSDEPMLDPRKLN